MQADYKGYLCNVWEHTASKQLPYPVQVNTGPANREKGLAR